MCRKICGIPIIVKISMAAFVLLVAPLPVIHQKYSTLWTAALLPGDTRIVPRSNVWCQGTELSSDKIATSATFLYLLRSMPTLSASSNFTIAENNSVIAPREYLYGTYHLHPGSYFSLTACVSSAAYFYVIKGSDNYYYWKYGYYTNSGNYLKIPFTNLCTNTNTNLKSYNLTISSEDDYYFIFDNRYYGYVLNVTFKMSFARTEYLIVPEDVVSSCMTEAFSSCYESIPYNLYSEYTVLVAASIPTEGKWLPTNVSASCEARIWVYAILEICIFIIVALCVISIVLCVCRDRVKKLISRKSAQETPITTVQPSQTATGPTNPVVTASAQPERQYLLARYRYSDLADGYSIPLAY